MHYVTHIILFILLSSNKYNIFKINRHNVVVPLTVNFKSVILIVDILLFQIMRHNKGRLAKNQMKKEDKSKQGSVFTDKDFAVFEKEYVT